MRLLRTLLFPPLFLLLLLVPQALFGGPAPLSSKDIRKVCERMFAEHARYKRFDKELAKRALSCFVDYLDPFKTYLTQKELEPFLEPSDQLLQEVVAGYYKDNYPIFEKVHELMLEAAKRKVRLSRFLENLPQIQGDLKGRTHPLDLKELIYRLRVIRSLQLAAGAKLRGAAAKDFPYLLEKNRLHFEKEIIGSDAEEQIYALHTGIAKACASALDSQSAYLTPLESKHFLMGMQKKLVGIGAVLRDDLEGLKITELLKGGPAEREGGLQVDDHIIAVDGKPIIGMHIIDAVEMIRGVRHTPVALTLMRAGSVLEVSLKRDEIIFHEARTKVEEHPFAEGHIAHIRLQTFYHDRDNSTARDIEKALKQSQKNGELKGVVLDLRGNPGGLLSEAIETAGLFIGRGIVASLKNGGGHIQHLRNLSWEPTYGGPLIILVDAFSASSSEIVAGALQDYGRALILGERTFGKGTFQLCTIGGDGRVSPLGEHKVTSGIYYTVSGKSPQLDGITPDIPVSWTDPQLEVGERFGKFPLDGGKIEPNFEDDLADVPIMQRSRIRTLYRLGKQEREESLKTSLPRLKANSQKRLAQNTYYNNCLENRDSPAPIDIQLEEALAVTKDLIHMQAGAT